MCVSRDKILFLNFVEFYKNSTTNAQSQSALQ